MGLKKRREKGEERGTRAEREKRGGGEKREKGEERDGRKREGYEEEKKQK